MKKMAISLTILFTAVKSFAFSVDVYTTSNYPILNQQQANHIYWLDRVEQIEEQLSQYINAQSDLSPEQFSQYRQTAAFQQLEQSLGEAYIGVTEGWKNGIVKVPAVLFVDDQQSAVVYGERDVQKAINLYRTFKQNAK